MKAHCKKEELVKDASKYYVIDGIFSTDQLREKVPTAGKDIICFVGYGDEEDREFEANVVISAFMSHWDKWDKDGNPTITYEDAYLLLERVRG